MSDDILLKNGSYQVTTSPSLTVEFSAADDIILPFRGTVVVPAAPGADPDFAHLGMHDFMFMSLKYPRSGSGDSSSFPFLRDFQNEPFTVNGHALFLVADDHSYLDDIDLGNLFSDITSVYEPAIKNNITLSCKPRYLCLQLDNSLFAGDAALPADAIPVSRSKGFKLVDNTDTEPGLVDLRDTLSGMSALSGRITAFDQAGRQTDAYSALMTLNINKTISDAPAADGNEVKVQFVDLHGNILTTGDFPLDHLRFDPVPAGGGSFGTNHYYTFSFSGDERKVKLRLETPPGTFSDDDPEYQYHFHYVGIWPGYSYELKEVTDDSSDIEIDLVKDFDSEEATQPAFVRICIFHPRMEFQTEVGGDIEYGSYPNLEDGKTIKTAKFEDNDLNFFTYRNSITVYNHGKLFLKALHDRVSELEDNEDTWYQANWRASPMLHMKGSMSLRNIKPNNLDSATVFDQLSEVLGSVIKLPVTGTADEFFLIPDRINGGDAFSDDFYIEISTLASPGVVGEKVSEAFVRHASIFAWKVKAAGSGSSTMVDSQLLAYWKDDLQQVASTTVADLHALAVGPLVSAVGIDFDPAWISLDIDDQDPPRLCLRRSVVLSTIRSTVGTAASESLNLWVLNPSAGGSFFISLAPTGSDDLLSDVVLTDASSYPDDSSEKEAITSLLNTYSARDPLYFAVVKVPSGDDDLLVDLLQTKLSEAQVFEDDAFRNGDIPLHPEEPGGLLRSTIAKGVNVKALFWEQNLAELSGGQAVRRGLSNNEAITNIINNHPASGERGYAFRDRSTRPFGSWHHKLTGIIKNVEPSIGTLDHKSFFVFLGGIDLSIGRWDTQWHLTHDPDRQGGMWYDVHMQIEGEAGFDILTTFKQRWEGIGTFLTTPGFDDCRPVNNSLSLEASATGLFEIPKPDTDRVHFPGGDTFVQINRTISPDSCFSELSGSHDAFISEDGELGSLASYKKGIQKARRFIIINEQYFFNLELALLLHQRLADEYGPDFLIVAVPKNLAESEYIDPHLFKLRKKAIQILYYGGTDSSMPGDSTCGEITANIGSTADENVKAKVAFMTPVNRDGDPVYTHAKHMIVDDVWMTIGSANMNNRSMTYDMEINAAMVNKKIFKGGGDIIRNHRIDICRQLLGLPNAYSSLLQDPYATFRLFKAIEGQEEGYSYRLHPKKLMVQWLDMDYMKRSDETAFNDEVDFVEGMEPNSADFNFLTCNVLDPDGRASSPSRLGFMASLAHVGKVPPTATGNLSFAFNSACETLIRDSIAVGDEVHLIVSYEVETDTGVFNGPFELDNYRLLISPETDNIYLDDLASGELPAPLSPVDTYVINVEIKDTTADSDLGSGTATFDPATISPPISDGSTHDETIICEA